MTRQLNLSNQPPKGARERMRAEPNPVYGKHILAPIFELNCRRNFGPLLTAHRAWLVMLAETGIVPRPDAAKILKALDDVEKSGPSALRPFDAAVEYFYLHMERALVERVPEGESIVGNLNLGRTRPEPLARMVVRELLLRVLRGVIDLRRALLDKAEAETDTVMPGYTHLQHAQPTTLGHYLAAIHDHLQRDTRRLFAAYDTNDRCTLGCGAMSGTSLPVDRERVRTLLGFSALMENTIDSVSASDHVAETAAALAGLLVILGRFCQDLYIWSSQEYSMIDVTDAFSSPSSLMPQKKNALVLEYVRARSARIIGALTGSFAVMHNVGYMDTEEVEIESYRPLFDAFDLVEEALPTVAAIVPAMVPDRDLMRRRAAWGFSSVSALAEAIQTQKSLSYRTAHRIVARAVLLAVERGKDATGIDSTLLDSAAMEVIGRSLKMDSGAIAAFLEPSRFVDQHRAVGSTAPDEVRRMIRSRRATLEDDAKNLTVREAAVRKGQRELTKTVGTLAGI